MRDRAGGEVVGIATAHDYPCVGEPDAEVMFTCPSRGVVSIVGLVPAGLVMDPPDSLADSDPVLLHLTACQKHSKSVRRWVTSRARSRDDVWVTGTAFLLAHWGQVVDPIELPVFGMVKTG